MENELNITFGKAVLTDKYSKTIFTILFEMFCKNIPDSEYSVHYTKGYFFLIRFQKKVPRLGGYKAFRIIIVKSFDKFSDLEAIEFVSNCLLEGESYKKRIGSFHFENNTLIIDSGCIVCHKSATKNLILFHINIIRKILKTRRKFLIPYSEIGLNPVDALSFKKQRPPFMYGNMKASNYMFNLSNKPDSFSRNYGELQKSTERWLDIAETKCEYPIDLTIKWP